MIEKHEAIQPENPIKSITDIIGTKTPLLWELTNNKIRFIKIDDSKLTATQKTNLNNYLSSHNPNLQDKS